MIAVEAMSAMMTDMNRNTMMIAIKLPHSV